ncbi:MBL fold metallo-hydrolase [Clostridium uliginosum]|uniref:L-ascorbate metabolism protein UlaG, beta-lactamase superfamily n=1 Tax=Clostridium uliginosum TaxID=119641 RepID=A0A1I1QL25_9CLOT|nr:MBL fold metallo-hydrolase [Clostridium uliginosum]SFD19973.1 L-ascorbate metabolism protein UlaG, beta-lactamase superfamily [Clostridium uliginosum]
MNFFNNINFLFHLTSNNVKEYFKKRINTKSDDLMLDSINWFGHATTVMNLSDKIIITDPVLSDLLGYFKRVVDKPTYLQNIKVDYILLSHGHMDHMHFPSLRKLNKDAIVIVPKGYKKILKLLGFKNVFLLHPGEIYEDNNLRVTAYEAKHDGRRFYVGLDNESLSYLIERNDKKVFFAGDTALTNNFKNITCDVALMPVGCYKPERFSHMHCTPNQSYEMFKMMNCPIMIPIHYKTFKLSLEDFEETNSLLLNLKDNNVKIINIGETYMF